MDVTLITKFSIKRDADHSNSLLCTLSVTHHFLRLGLGYRFPKMFGEKCYDHDHKDIRSALDFHAATGGTLCSGANGR